MEKINKGSKPATSMAFQLDYDQTKLWGACDSGDIPRLFAASA